MENGEMMSIKDLISITKSGKLDDMTLGDVHKVVKATSWEALSMGPRGEIDPDAYSLEALFRPESLDPKFVQALAEQLGVNPDRILEVFDSFVNDAYHAGRNAVALQNHAEGLYPDITNYDLDEGMFAGKAPKGTPAYARPKYQKVDFSDDDGLLAEANVDSVAPIRGRNLKEHSPDQIPEQYKQDKT